MWPGFDSRTRRHMWVEFVVGSRPCSERFFSGYSGFPLSSKTNISKFRFDLESEGHKFISLGLLCATLVKQSYLFIYLFIYLMWPGFDSRTRRQMWVEFVVGSRPCSERFFSGYSGFPLSSKTNISKFQLTLKSPERDEPIKYVFIYLFIYSCG